MDQDGPEVELSVWLGEFVEDTAQDDSDGEDSEVPLRQHSLLLVVPSRRTTNIRKTRFPASVVEPQVPLLLEAREPLLLEMRDDSPRDHPDHPRKRHNRGAACGKIGQGHGHSVCEKKESTGTLDGDKTTTRNCPVRRNGTSTSRMGDGCWR